MHWANWAILFVRQEAEEKKPDLLFFPEQLPRLKEAAELVILLQLTIYRITTNKMSLYPSVNPPTIHNYKGKKESIDLVSSY